MNKRPDFDQRAKDFYGAKKVPVLYLLKSTYMPGFYLHPKDRKYKQGPIKSSEFTLRRGKVGAFICDEASADLFVIKIGDLMKIKYEK
jgi:hypothetical protein